MEAPAPTLSLHQYQKDIVSRLHKQPYCALFLEMGLGKTAIILTLMQELTRKEPHRRWLIVAPAPVVAHTYPGELARWAPKLTHFSIPAGLSEDRRLQKVQDNWDKQVCILSHTLTKAFFEEGLHHDFNSLIVDESTKFKNPTSKTFKVVSKNLGHFTRRYIMTGTPIPNGYEDLWSQMYLIDRGERLGSKFSVYRHLYFKKDSWNIYSWTLEPGAAQTIKRRVSDIVISLTLSDTPIQLPPYLPTITPLNMNRTLVTQYNALKKDFLLMARQGTTHCLKDTLILKHLQHLQALHAEDAPPPPDEGIPVIASTAASLVNKLLQFCSGAIYTTSTQYTILHDLKTTHIQEVLHNHRNRILLAYNYKHEAQRLAATYPDDIIIYDKNPKTLDAWTKGATPRVLAVHPASLSHGLNLQYFCNVIVWYGFTWSLEHYSQLNGRLLRQGQKYTVYCIHLAAGEMEYRLLTKLSEKDTTQQQLMDYLEALTRTSHSHTGFTC